MSASAFLLVNFFVTPQIHLISRLGGLDTVAIKRGGDVDGGTGVDGGIGNNVGSGVNGGVGDSAGGGLSGGVGVSQATGVNRELKSSP